MKRCQTARQDRHQTAGIGLQPMARRVDSGEPNSDQPVDRAVRSALDHLGDRQIRARPSQTSRFVKCCRVVTGLHHLEKPDRLTSGSFEAPRGGEPGPFPRDRPAPSGIGGPDRLRRHDRHGEKLRPRGPANDEESRDGDLTGQAGRSDVRARARSEPGRPGAVDASPGDRRACRSQRHRGGLLLRAPQGDLRVLGVPEGVVSRLRVDRGRADLRGHKLRDGLDAVTSRDPHDPVAGDRDFSARGQRAQLDPARRRGRVEQPCRSGCSATPASIPPRRHPA